ADVAAPRLRTLRSCGRRWSATHAAPGQILQSSSRDWARSPAARPHSSAATWIVRPAPRPALRCAEAPAGAARDRLEEAALTASLTIIAGASVRYAALREFAS